MPESESGDAPKRIAYVIPLRLETVYVKNAILEEWLQSTHTRPISLFLLVRPTAEEFRAAGFRPQAIISKLRDIYGQTGAAFSVLSEKHGRMLISVLSRKETTGSQPNSISSDGPASSSSAPPSPGQDVSLNGADDDYVWPPRA